MKHKFLLLFLLFMLFCASAGFAADSNFEKGDFWFCPSGEFALYSPSGTSFGGGLAVGYGRGTSFGIKTAWFYSSDKLNVLEINVLFRVYFFGKQAYSGPFIQFIGGPVLVFGKGSEISIPSKIGAFSIGGSFGWRFLIKDRWFIEPSVRGGYPYLFGAGISAGMRF